MKDIEDLLSSVISENAKISVYESIKCYQSGAYRASVISTWLSIVFDYISKLQELKNYGIGLAKEEIEKLQEDRINGNIRSLLDFEDLVLKNSHEKYQFITREEMEILKRIKDDRNLCAHPSIDQSYNPFKISPEAARYHLYNAVDIFLSKPATLGSGAFEFICTMIKSHGFPMDVDQAKIYLKSNILRRPNETLIKKLTKGLSIWIINEQGAENEKYRVISAIESLKQLYPQWSVDEYARTVNEKASILLDEDYHRFYFLCRYIPDTYGMLDDDIKIRSSNILKNINHANLNTWISDAEQIEGLKDVAEKRKLELLEKEINSAVNDDVQKRATLVSDFYTSPSFSMAERHAVRLAGISKYLSEQDVYTITKAFAQNSQVKYARRVPEQLFRIFSSTMRYKDPLKDNWHEVYNILNTLDETPSISVLIKNIEDQFPDFIEKVDEDNR